MTPPTVGTQHARGASPEQVWQHQAATVLRKAGRLSTDAPDDEVWSALARQTVEGLVVPPLGVPRSGVPVESAPEDDARRDGPHGGWDIRALIADPDPALAAQAAVDEWEHGSSSLWLTVGGPGIGPADLGPMLERLPLHVLPVVISASGATTEVETAQAFSDVLGRRDLPGAPSTSFGGDPLGRLLRHGAVSPIDGTIPRLAALATELGIGALVADGTVAHQYGAGDAVEIGYTLAAAVHYLRELRSSGYSIADSLSLLEFRLAATDDQFVTIAKFRAFRVLWKRIADLSGAPAGTLARVHAVTSPPMMTRYDAWTNLLRTTVAAFAAGAGGATSLTVLPFDSALGIPEGQGRRLARNISALLTAEAHVADVGDPAGGSWAVEELTDTVADAAWAEFLRIEESGGVVAAAGDGSLRSRFAETGTRRRHCIATRRQPITGVSEFPDAAERLPLRRPFPANLGDQPSSWAAPFESLRDEPTARAVFLATLGPLAAHATRAGFVTNALAAGGVSVLTAGPTEGVEDVIAAFGADPSPVVCLTGTDRAYQDQGRAVISALRAAGARRIILAGRPADDVRDFVDDHLAAGDDLLAFLERTREALAERDSPTDEDGPR